MVEISGSDLDVFGKKRVVRVTLNSPYYLVRYGDRELFRISETSDVKRIPTIREVVGYITGYRVRNTPFKDSAVLINPFGGVKNVTLDESLNRAGDVMIELRYIGSIEEVVSVNVPLRVPVR